jgi:putative tryptophan/tyrosine transport system substrate-binding protein
MKRREFITVLGAAAAWPLAAHAQQGDRVRRIGALIVLGETDPESRRRVMAFEQSLDKLGWSVGRNLMIDYRFDISDDERARVAAAELLRLAPDVILANSVVATRAAQQVTRTVPIVFTAISEPIAQGFVESIAHPGGNTTGFSNLEPSLGAKWLELLKEIAPRVMRIAVISSAAGSLHQLFYRSIEAAAPKFRVETIEVLVRGAEDIEAVITRLASEPSGGLIFPPDTVTAPHNKLIVALAERHRLPAIYAFQYFAAAGGLVSYGPNPADQFRRAATYIDRIFRGERPGDLPVQQPTKFELVINLKAARALGLEIPDKLLALADEVIE